MLIPKSVSQIATVAAKDESRYAIHGVHVGRAPDGTPFAVATDGKRLLALTWREEDPQGLPADVGDVEHVEGFQAIIPAREFKDAGKLAAKGRMLRARPILGNVLLDEKATLANGVAVLAGTDLEAVRKATPRKVEGTFPEWREVMPSYGDGKAVTVTVSASLLAGLLQAMAKVAPGEEGAPAVNLTIPKASGKPILVETADKGEIRARGVLMPIVLE